MSLLTRWTLPVGRHGRRTARVRPTILSMVLAVILLVAANSSSAQTSAVGSSLTSYYDNNHQILHVIYQGANGQIIDLYYQYSSRTWNVVGLTNPSSQGLFSVTSSFFDGTNGHVFSVCPSSNSGNAALGICELYGSTLPTNYFFHNTTSPPGARYQGLGGPSGPPPLRQYSANGTNYWSVQYGSDGSLSTLWDGTTEHVYFMAFDQTIHELYYNSGWWEHSIGTIGSFGPQLVTHGMGLASLWDGVQHIFVWEGIELYYNGTWNKDMSWVYNGNPPGGYLTAVDSGGPDLWGQFDPPNGNLITVTRTNDSWLSNAYGAPANQCSPGPVPLCNANPMLSFNAPYFSSTAEVFYVGTDSNIYWIPNGNNGNGPAIPILPSSASRVAKDASSPGFYGGYWAPIAGYSDATYLYVFYVGNNDIFMAYSVPSNRGAWTVTQFGTFLVGANPAL
jgi:hypothetical protein